MGAKTGRRMILYLFYLVFVGSLGIVGYGVWTLREAREISNWPTVSGKIVSADAIRHTWTTRRGRRRESLKADIHYTYTVGGTTHKSDRVFYSDYNQAGMESLAREQLGKYKVGNDVVVHYRPKDPSFAVLEVGMNLNDYVPLGAGLIAALLTGILALLVRGTLREMD